MTRAESLAEIQDAFRPYPRRLTNNYLMPADVKKLADSGCLSYITDENAAYLYERRSGYLKFFFQLNNTSAKLPENAEPLIAYVVFRDTRKNDEIMEWLEEQGFKVRAERIHLVTDSLSAEPSLEGVSKATHEEAESLFMDSFDPFSADMPLSQHCGEFLAIRNDDLEPLGIVHCGNPFIIAVSKSARRQKIATRLFSAYAAFMRSASCKLWTDADNFAAHELYSKLGFAADGLKATCFIKE